MDIQIIKVTLSPDDMAAGHHLPLLGTALGQPSLPPAPPPYYPPGDWVVPAVPVPPTGPPPPAPMPMPNRWAGRWRWLTRNWVPVCLGVGAGTAFLLILPTIRTVETATPMTPSTTVEPLQEQMEEEEAGEDSAPEAATPAAAPPPPPPSPVLFPAIPRPD